MKTKTSDLKKFPKKVILWCDLAMNSFPTAFKSILSVTSLWKFKISWALNLTCFIVDLCHVFKRLVIEYERSADADAAGFISKKTSAPLQHLEVMFSLQNELNDCVCQSRILLISACKFVAVLEVAPTGTPYQGHRNIVPLILFAFMFNYVFIFYGA